MRASIPLAHISSQVRQGLKKFSNWPTYPQLYANGELIGGLDIVKVSSYQGQRPLLCSISVLLLSCHSGAQGIRGTGGHSTCQVMCGHLVISSYILVGVSGVFCSECTLYVPNDTGGDVTI